MRQDIKLFWVEEDGFLTVCNQPSQLATFSLETEFPCPIQGYCVPFDNVEMGAILHQSDDVIGFIQSSEGQALLSVMFEEMAW